MVTNKLHGGDCCGARHLFGFNRLEEEDPNLINRALAISPNERATEVILNDVQVANYPNILQRLSDLGFVLDGHWINGNHDSHNYRFTRCDNREPLELPQWDAVGGMVINAGLAGGLPPMNANPFPQQQGPQRHINVNPEGVENNNQAPVTLVHCTYHGESREGRRGGGYDTVEQARANLGRRRIIRRRAFYSDGRVEWDGQTNYF